MSLIFANPIGLLSLLGIPALILIHSLQHTLTRHPLSTAFLLPHTVPPSLQGRCLLRFRYSHIFLCQTLSVLLLSWLLAEPRWLQSHSKQTIILILDNSASMSAFHKQTTHTLSQTLSQLHSQAHHTEWILMETAPSPSILYRGTSTTELQNHLHQHWDPTHGEHDFTPAWEQARQLKTTPGHILFITDHILPTPPDIHLISIGQPLPNVGFTGLRTDSDRWQTMIKNYSPTPTTRSWHVTSPEKNTPSTTQQHIELAPYQTLQIEGPFPAHPPHEIQLHLTPADNFTLDDTLPIIRPSPKLLKYYVEGPESLIDFIQKIAPILGHLEQTHYAHQADLAILETDAAILINIQSHAITFLKSPTENNSQKLQPSTFLLAENHPLLRDLSPQSLQLPHHPQLTIPHSPTQITLLWHQNKPILALRTTAQNHQQLLFASPFTHTNIPRSPSGIILIQRFIDHIRQQKIAPEQTNMECSQLHPIAFSKNEAPLKQTTSLSTLDTRSWPFPSTIRAPQQPCFYTLSTTQNKELFRGATHFADTREAHLQNAAAHNSIPLITAQNLVRNTSPDPWRWLWTLLILILLITSWHLQAPPRS